MIINPPETMNVISLYFDKVTSNGMVVTKLATVAPNPKKTNNAGKAQQISVVVEANRTKYFIKPLFFNITSYF